jgi:hypothetical protein
MMVSMLFILLSHVLTPTSSHTDDRGSDACTANSMACCNFRAFAPTRKNGFWCSLVNAKGVDTTGKPANRDWHEPQGPMPEKAFFKLEVELRD